MSVYLALVAPETDISAAAAKARAISVPRLLARHCVFQQAAVAAARMFAEWVPKCCSQLESPP